MPPTTHTLSLVHIDGQDWIADAGFGGSYSPPMPLVEGAEATAPDGALFRLDRDPQHGWMLLRNGHPGLTDGRATGEGWQPQYSFTTDHVWDADLALANHWTSTAPESRFRQATIVSIILPRGFASLTDRHYRRRVGEDETAGTITDPRVYRMRLSLMFGLDLTARKRLRCSGNNRTASAMQRRDSPPASHLRHRRVGKLRHAGR